MRLTLLTSGVSRRVQRGKGGRSLGSVPGMSPAGGIVALRARNEAKMMRGHGPDAAKTDLDTGQAFGLIPEDRSIVGLAIMIVILEEGNSVI